MKTSELTGAALDWAVAKITNPEWWEDGYMDGDPMAALDMDDGNTYSPSTDWAQGGPIIEREKIKIAPNLGGTWHGQIRHEKDHPRVAQKVLAGWTNQHGPTPLIAAMRCLVASKLGEDIEVPQELI